MSRTNLTEQRRSIAAGVLLALLAACGTDTTAPSFTANPKAITVVEREPATFEANVTGSELKYQWAKNDTAIAGATAASYTTPATTVEDDQAVFAVTATNSHGSVTASGAQLRVNWVRITSGPLKRNVAAGGKASFTVAATGSGTLSYQWRRDGADIDAATSSTFEIPEAVAGDAGDYSCAVTSTLNGTTVTVTTDGAGLRVVMPPLILVQPRSVTVIVGDPAMLSVTASGSGDLTYQWKKEGVEIPGATESFFAFDSTIPEDAGVYTCVVTNTDQGFRVTQESSPATLTVAEPGTLTDSGDLIVAEGKSGSLSVTAAVVPGMSAPTFQWWHDGIELVGATNAKYTIAAATAADAGSYRCVVTSSVNGVEVVATSNVMNVTVVAPPVITGQPTGATLNSGGSVTLTVVAAANNMIGYQWQRKGVHILGATSASYSISAAKATDAGEYTCIVSNTLNGVSATTVSASATIVVKAAPVITGQPADQSVIEGQTATFTVTAAGSGLSYQWSRNGTPIAGANSPSYTTPTLTISDSGATYSCAIANGFPPDTTSRAALLTVNPIPTVFNVSATKISKGEGVILTFTFGGTATLKLGGATPVPVTSGGHIVDYPLGTTTYILTVTDHGITTPTSLVVTVNTYVAQYLYTANYGANNVARFKVTFGPLLVSNGYHSLGTVAAGTGPIHITTSPNEKRLYVANRESGDISVFDVIDPTTGELWPVMGSPFALGTDSNPFASAIDPSGQRLYVAGNDAVTVFNIASSTGILTRAPSLDVRIPSRLQGDLLMHPSGKFLFVADYGHDVVKSYSVDPATGALTFVGNVPASGGPTGLTFDRAATRLFTRGAVTTGDHNAVIHVIAIDPYTGALTAMSSYEGFDNTSGLPFVRGAEAAVRPTNPSVPFDPYGLVHHGLAFSKKPGVDVLYNCYHGEDVAGTSMSAYNVNVATGTIIGDFTNPALPGSPFAIGAWLYHSWAGSLAIDRGGSVIFLGSTYHNGNAAAYLSSATGTLTGPQIAIGGIPEYYLVPGNNPAHAVFSGEMTEASATP